MYRPCWSRVILGIPAISRLAPTTLEIAQRTIAKHKADCPDDEVWIEDENGNKVE